ncbi:MAG: DUF6644 family protein [Steroidobacteraceae bacterium]
MIQAFCEWLSNTSVSMVIQNVYWIIPVVQTVHILAIATVMASVVMLDFRLLGVTARGQALPDVAHRFLPWVWSAVVVLLCSGSLLIIAEPGRDLLNNVFYLKMSLLACVLVLTFGFQVLVRRGGGFWEHRRMIARITAVVSLALWVGIVMCGRWIAYVAHG